MEREHPVEPSRSDLPCPSTDADSPVPNSPRERTRRHMRRLLKAAAMGLAASNLGAGCVVDPAPPPISCSQDLTESYLSQFMGWTGEWVDVETAGPAVSLNVYISTTGLDFADQPTVLGATVLYAAKEPGRMTFALVPAAGATSIQVSIPVTCGEKTATLTLAVDVTGDRQAGTYVTITTVGD